MNQLTRVILVKHKVASFCKGNTMKFSSRIPFRFTPYFFIGNLLIIILLICFNKSIAQPVRITNNYIFPKGIYTCFDELLHNTPRYLNCELDVVKPPAGYPRYFYYDSLKVRRTFYDSCFAVVSDGVLFIRELDFFYKSLYLGAISIFVSTNWHSVHQQHYRVFEDYYYILDFETGKMLPFDQDGISGLLKRDAELYAEFSAKNRKIAREIMLSYILKYNTRNSFYLK
jgi:hypothetical protein